MYQNIRINYGEINIYGGWHYALLEDGSPIPDTWRFDGQYMVTERDGKTYVCLSGPYAVDPLFIIVGNLTLFERAFSLGISLANGQKKQARKPRHGDLPDDLQREFSSYVRGWQLGWENKGRKVSL